MAFQKDLRILGGMRVEMREYRRISLAVFEFIGGLVRVKGLSVAGFEPAMMPLKWLHIYLLRLYISPHAQFSNSLVLQGSLAKVSQGFTLYFLN